MNVDEDFDRCPNCEESGHIIDDESTGDRLCTNCGFVLQEICNNGREWARYDDEKDDTQVRADYTTQDYSWLGTDQGKQSNYRLFARARKEGKKVPSGPKSGAARTASDFKYYSEPLTSGAAANASPTATNSPTPKSNDTMVLIKNDPPAALAPKSRESKESCPNTFVKEYSVIQTKEDFVHQIAESGMLDKTHEWGSRLTLTTRTVETAKSILREWGKSQRCYSKKKWLEDELIIAALITASRIEIGETTPKMVCSQFPKQNIKRISKHILNFPKLPNFNKNFSKKPLSKSVVELTRSYLNTSLPDEKQYLIPQLMQKAGPILTQLVHVLEGKQSSYIACVAAILVISANHIQIDPYDLCHISGAKVGRVKALLKQTAELNLPDATL